jgi:hypothetical protein
VKLTARYNQASKLYFAAEPSYRILDSEHQGLQLHNEVSSDE